ncbi:MAG: ATP-binding cassette domain-containing protein [Pseudomonadota bacterium]
MNGSAGASLEVSGLRKTLPDGQVLIDDVSFRVEAGEFVGLLGASGAGKSLSLRCILGLTRATAGSILFHDATGRTRELSSLRGRELRAARRRIGVVFQGSNLVRRLTVLENVMIGRVGSIHPVRSWCYGFTDDEARAAWQALAQCKIERLAHRVTGSLSGGEMQRVAIARAIHQEPDLYLADEPVSSLDPGNATAIMEMLRPLAAISPVLGVFHQPELVARYCTRVVALKDGRVFYDGEPTLSAILLREIYGEELSELRAVVPAADAAEAEQRESA